MIGFGQNQRIDTLEGVGGPLSGYNKEGLWKYYINQSDTLYREVTYVNGIKNGISRWWYGNSQLQMEANYKNGWPTGIISMWHPNGQLSGRRMYEEGGYLKKEYLYEECWDEEGNEIDCGRRDW